MEEAARQLAAEGVKYFVASTDKADDKVYVQGDAQGEDFCYILSAALPTRADAVNLGIWVGNLIAVRRAQEEEKTN